MTEISDCLERLEGALDSLRAFVAGLRELVDALPGTAKAVGSGAMGAGGIACIATGGYGVGALDGRPGLTTALGVAIALPLFAALWQFPRRLLYDETRRERSRREVFERTPSDLADQLDVEAKTRRVLSDSFTRQPSPSLERRPIVGGVLRDLDEALRRNGHEKPVLLLTTCKAGTRAFEVVVDRGPADDGLKEGNVWDVELVRDSGGRPFEKVLEPYCYGYHGIPFYAHDDEYCLLALSARPFSGNEALRISHAATDMLVQMVVEDRGEDRPEEASDA